MSEKITREDFRNELGMALHTAFRKASDHDNTVKIHELISELPEDDWLSIIDFVCECLTGFEIEG